MSSASSQIAGKVGQGLSFSGSNSAYVEVANINSSSYATNFSASAWINPSTLSGANEYTVFGTRLNNTSGWQLGIGATAGTCGGSSCLIWRTFNGGSQFSMNTGATNYVPINSWTHVAVVHTNGNASLYVNGNLVATQAITNPAQSGAQPFRIGFIGQGSGGFSWTGGLDEVRVYNRALSASEVKELYLIGK
jgi:hypothetical protein